MLLKGCELMIKIYKYLVFYFFIVFFIWKCNVLVLKINMYTFEYIYLCVQVGTIGVIIYCKIYKILILKFNAEYVGILL